MKSYINIESIRSDLKDPSNIRIYNRIMELIGLPESPATHVFQYLTSFLTQGNILGFTADESFNLYLKFCNCYQIDYQLEALKNSLGDDAILVPDIKHMEELKTQMESSSEDEGIERIRSLLSMFVITINKSMSHKSMEDKKVGDWGTFFAKEEHLKFFSDIIRREAFKKADKAFDAITKLPEDPSKKKLAEELANKYAIEAEWLFRDALGSYDEPDYSQEFIENYMRKILDQLLKTYPAQYEEDLIHFSKESIRKGNCRGLSVLYAIARETKTVSSFFNILDIIQRTKGNIALMTSDQLKDVTDFIEKMLLFQRYSSGEHLRKYMEGTLENSEGINYIHTMPFIQGDSSYLANLLGMQIDDSKISICRNEEKLKETLYNLPLNSSSIIVTTNHIHAMTIFITNDDQNNKIFILYDSNEPGEMEGSVDEIFNFITYYYETDENNFQVEVTTLNVRKNPSPSEDDIQRFIYIISSITLKTESYEDLKAAYNALSDDDISFIQANSNWICQHLIKLNMRTELTLIRESLRQIPLEYHTSLFMSKVESTKFIRELFADHPNNPKIIKLMAMSDLESRGRKIKRESTIFIALDRAQQMIESHLSRSPGGVMAEMYLNSQERVMVKDFIRKFEESQTVSKVAGLTQAKPLIIHKHNPNHPQAKELKEIHESQHSSQPDKSDKKPSTPGKKS